MHCLTAAHTIYNITHTCAHSFLSDIFPVPPSFPDPIFQPHSPGFLLPDVESPSVCSSFCPHSPPLLTAQLISIMPIINILEMHSHQLKAKNEIIQGL